MQIQAPRVTLGGVLLLCLTLALAVWSAGCAASPLAPTPVVPAATSVPLLVQALYLGTTVPLSGVSVLQDGRLAGVTDKTGTVVLAVTLGREVTVHVDLNDYTSPVPTVAAVPSQPNEVWTFRLENR